MMTADEMIKVIQAWKNGKEIEFLWHNHEDYEDWELTTDPEWNFPEVDYRIKPAEIAAGRNPEGLTVDQIKSYRCLSYEEFDGLEENNYYDGIYLRINPNIEPCGVIRKLPSTTYFTDKPEGYFLPKAEPEKPYWNKPEDVPIQQGGIWLRDKNESEGHTALIIGITANGVILISKEFYSWEELQEKEYYNGSEWQECRCK